MIERADQNIEEDDEMQHAVARRRHRQARYDESGERPIWQNLSMIGALGWLIVLPVVTGALVGSWLDSALGTGITMSGALIFVGAIVGGLLAWQRINRN